MPYKNAEKQREYKRVWIKKKRNQERVRQEAETEKTKLKLVEELLVSKYSLQNYKHAPVIPKVVRWKSVFGPIVTMRVKPSLTKRVYEFVGEGRYTYPAPPENWVPHITSVIERTKKNIVDKQTRVKVGSVKVEEARVIVDFREYMNDDLADIIGEEWETRFQLFSEKMLNSPVYAEKWRKMRDEQKASEEAFINFVIEGIIDKKTEEQIIKEARDNAATSSFFRFHGNRDFSLAWAKKMFKEVKGCLPS